MELFNLQHVTEVNRRRIYLCFERWFILFLYWAYNKTGCILSRQWDNHIQ